MNKIEITGGCSLEGNVNVHGSKNSVLPMLAASILTEEKVTLLNCPHIEDVHIMLKILKDLGCKVEFDNHKVQIDASVISNHKIVSKEAKSLRASFLFLGSLLGRLRRAEISHPGGCTIGKRPINLHVEAIEKLGVEFEECENECILKAYTGSLTGSQISFHKKSVGASQNCILAAVL